MGKGASGSYIKNGMVHRLSEQAHYRRCTAAEPALFMLVLIDLQCMLTADINGYRLQANHLSELLIHNHRFSGVNSAQSEINKRRC